jgi:hypothetical protein
LFGTADLIDRIYSKITGFNHIKNRVVKNPVFWLFFLLAGYFILNLLVNRLFIIIPYNAERGKRKEEREEMREKR